MDPGPSCWSVSRCASLSTDKREPPLAASRFSKGTDSRRSPQLWMSEVQPNMWASSACGLANDNVRGLGGDVVVRPVHHQSYKPEAASSLFELSYRICKEEGIDIPSV